MKLFLVLCLVAAVFADDVSDDDIKKWKEFKVQHGKMFMSKNKEAARMKNFLKHNAKIEAINEKFAEGESTYTAKIYAHHDLSREEFTARYCGAKKDNSTVVRMAPVMRQTPPSCLDLTTSPEVGAVKNQGQCGSCWTFSTTAATESRYYRNTNNPIILSEQQLVNCVTSGCNGCNGGWMPNAFAWIQNNGQTIGTSVPYTGVDGTCTTAPAYFYAKGQVQIPSDVNSIKNALNTNGVLAIAVDASYWGQYGTGIFTIPSNKFGGINHAVALVGYGTDKSSGIAYWKIRNSWGPGWGEKGYIRVPITTSSTQSNTYVADYTFAVL